MTKLHFVEDDTDSAYWAISGQQIILNNSNQQQYEDNLHQGFKYVIRDQQFYDANAKYFFPTIDGDKSDEKKLLDVSESVYAYSAENLLQQAYEQNCIEIDQIVPEQVTPASDIIPKESIVDCYAGISNKYF
ncbi:MAG: hypothetical protein EZS28_034818 [Streblomastix strix]|uniref:Uncharacterized protein n=1 Tax=Streblomastix strix TaxID=222440 RepID=A0A5J4UJ86_9EUKA|nr:MAG: hypothetical protein EZS28_034818 [Streblomastix strix]